MGDLGKDSEVRERSQEISISKVLQVNPYL